MKYWLVKKIRKQLIVSNLKHLAILMKDDLYFMRFPPIVLNVGSLHLKDFIFHFFRAD